MRLRVLSLFIIVALAGVAGGAAGAVLSGRPQAPATAAQFPVGVAPGPAAHSPFVAPAARVRPAVVNISTEQKVPNPFGEFQQFFGDIPGLPSGPIQQRGIGSGVIVSRDGYILTNAHVVQGVNQLTVTLTDGRTFKGTVIGDDPVTDLAVVKIPSSNLPVAQLGDSSWLQPGDWAIAIGNPYGLNFTVTVGVVSATGRSLPDSPDEAMIQTDAPINPGNSGGPLVDMAGQVVGITTAKFAGAQGIGFAIPINTAKGIMQQLIATGRVVRPYLGVYIQAVTPELVQAMHLRASTEGVLIADVAPNSPAAAAGLERGDVIMEAAGQHVTSPEALVARVHKMRVGTPLLLLVERNGRTQYATVRVGQMPPGE